MNESISISSEKDLQKAWLKQKFASYAYHEELLENYDRWCKLLEHHWSRPEILEKYPDRAKTMNKIVIPNLREVSRPRSISKEDWKDGNKSGWASTILYNINKGMGYQIDDPYIGIPESESHEVNILLKKIIDGATNIRRTSDSTWEKNKPYAILDTEITGPITWPANWTSELPPKLVTASEQNISPGTPAGQPCPRTGWWFTPARANSRRHFKQGDIFPVVEGSSYGDTFWQWSPDQAR